MKVKEITELKSFLVEIDNQENYIRYCEDNWYKCLYDKDEYIEDEKLVKKLEEAYQEYLK